MKTDCPSDQWLRRYAIGDVDEVRGHALEEHLGECAACEDSVARFDSAEDTLMRHLPLAAARAAEVSSDAPGWLERLRKGPPAERAADFDSAPANGASGRLAPSSAYELLRVLGRGGMGVVYRARHRQLNRHVALKVLSPRLMATPEARRRFEREIQVLGGLHHPGIVMATDAGRMGGAAYLVMELIDGVDLARLVRQTGPLTVAEACEAARQMAEALAVAHRAGTVHRDVKPSNAMVDRQGRVKLLDFGLAHLAALSSEGGETAPGRLLGTPEYLAPEQADAGRPIDARADLFGLGATLFYLLTGRPPHGVSAGRSLLDQLRALTTSEAPRVSSLRADVPPELDEFIARLLSREPDERPDSAEAAAAVLATWAGGDLAARVEEVPVRHGEDEASCEEREAAQRSLSELLGVPVLAASPEWFDSQAGLPESERGCRRSRWNRVWPALAALALGGLVFGVTILLRTPEGTLRIESEVDDVRVELLDEADQPRELLLTRGRNETTLRAGRYRIRLAGEYDGVTLDRDVITLRRGEELLARITRNATGPAVAARDAEATERLYQGTPESEWQRRFAAEMAPVEKLEAARALLFLAAELPPEDQIERILDVGEGIVRASFVAESLRFALESGSEPPLGATRWPLYQRGKPYEAYRVLQGELARQVRNLPGEALARHLSRAALAASDARTAFAVSLLRHAATPWIQSDPAAAHIVVRELDVPLTGLDRSALLLLARSRYLTHASADERQRMFGLLNELALKLRSAPAETFNDKLRDELLGMPGRAEWPVSLRKMLAFLILDEIVERRGGGLRGLMRFAFGMGVPPYRQEYVAELRSSVQPVLDVWVSVANEYLAEHRDALETAAVRDVVRSLDLVLLAYSDGDEWPVDQTAALLTEQLRAYYTDDPQRTAERSVADLLPADPATLLTQIVRITGEIPEFVRTRHPRAESVARRLNRLETLLSGAVDVKQARWEFDSLMGLLDEAPYDVIKLSVGEHKLPSRTQIILRGLDVPLNPTELLYVTSRLKDDRNNRRAPPTDPLLLLAVLADLTGQSEEQDERIATLIEASAPKVLLRGHLENLLSSQLQAREHARRLLHKMAANARSPELIERIEYLDPALARSTQQRP